MKVAPFIGFLVAVSVFQHAHSRPLEGELDELEKEKETKNAAVYVLGSLHNAAVSQDFSKSQAASDRNESEWNSTGMINKVNQQTYDEDMKRDARVLIYAGGDASNLSIAYEGSESQASENDQKSGYNSQNLGLGSGAEYEVEREDEERRK